MKDQDLKLVSFEFAEWMGRRLNWEVKRFPLGDLTLILSDNAQGKTRLLNILSFLKQWHTGGRPFLNPGYRARCEFWFDAGQDEIVYLLRMHGVRTGPGLSFNEVIKRNGKVLFDRQKNILIDEKSGQRVDKFLLPPNLPVVSSVPEKGYFTFNALRSFFQRMLFLQANRFAGGEVGIERNAMLLNPKGSNIGCVMEAWKERLPSVYQEVLDVFRDVFPFIKHIYTKESSIGETHAPMLFMKEENVKIDINQMDWSDGLLRALCHIALACTQFPKSGNVPLRPSIIGIDEVENGLDFNTLTKVINHYESYSGLVQTLIATHSPLVCNMIDPANWLIVRRKGERVRLFSPGATEDLKFARSKLRKDNWEFYRRHIAKSDLYRIK